MRRLLLLPCLLLMACADSRLPFSNEDLPMNPMTDLKAKLAFTCTHEQIPAASEESDVLFQYARWLQKNNQLKRDKTINLEIERLYRIAAENGHFKANINLQNGGMRGQFEVYGHEYLRFSQDLIDADVATGYYLISLLLEKGGAGLQQDPDMALRYLSKAANVGNARAQFFIAEKLEPSNIAPNIALQMFRCAADQGHGDAGVALGIHQKIKQEYSDALELFQQSVAAGDEGAANRLANSFRGIKPDDKIYYLAQQEDLERADRYEKIWRILANYSYANPKVPEINDIVPLPPAKLPPWDGKLKWLEEREANIPPEKPSQELIQRL
ncbi:MAG: SEL1-like repeat protein, partial [Pseudomonas sp.]|uniref:SEL1-like repeat protein n=1 Tax=Pseudomonas sp. TaxID=306 RepID=UPI003D6F9B18